MDPGALDACISVQKKVSPQPPIVTKEHEMVNFGASTAGRKMKQQNQRC